MRILVKRVRPHARLPEYMSPQASGMDLYCSLDAPITLQPGERAAIPTGISVAIPQGWELQIRPRSGLALRHGITLLNSPGTIDADYRGEIHLILANLGNTPFTIEPFMRLAQAVVTPVVRGRLEEVEELPPSPRGEGGFGHTGL